MSKLLQKSEFNFDSAQLLINNHYFAPSIHCYYFSCYQKLLHILFHILNKDESYLRNLQRNSTTREGSHEIAINEIFKTITNFKIAREFNTRFVELKKLRRESDYEDKEILSDKSSKAASITSDIMEILKNRFKV